MNSDKLSKAELEVLKIIWRLESGTVNEIQFELNSGKPKNEHLAYTTIATMLKRIVEKGAAVSNKENRSYIFSATEKLSDYKTSKLSDFVGQFFDGQPSSLASYFIENSKFTEEELKALSKLIEEKKSE